MMDGYMYDEEMREDGVQLGEMEEKEKWEGPYTWRKVKLETQWW